MSGRLDYEERKERKKEIYQERADKAKKQASEYHRQHEQIANSIPMGQPILTDHYSAPRHRRDIKRMDNLMGKAVSESEKADYYEDKLSSIDDESKISSDDPKAIEKLQKKLETLEDYKKKVKARKHETYELTSINAEMRRIRERIKEIQELEEINFQEISFNGGKIIHNKEINRIQIVFDDIPDENVRDNLKRNGFKWARSEGAWQRLFNKNSIYAVRRLINSGVLEVLENEKMS